MEVLTSYLTKPKYRYKHASISCFVNHGPQMLTASVLLVLFEPLVHDCDPRYLKPTILAFFGSPSLAQNGHFGPFCYYSWNIGFWVTHINQGQPGSPVVKKFNFDVTFRVPRLYMWPTSLKTSDLAWYNWFLVYRWSSWFWGPNKPQLGVTMRFNNY